MKKALIVYGGWDGHEPVEVSQVFAEILEKEGFAAERSDDLDRFAAGDLMDHHLIVPVWTQGDITDEQLDPVVDAVAHGVGIAGCHGGMCDAFRESVQWQFMTGGNWVAHPGNDGTEHVVNIKRGTSPLVEGIEDFSVATEQYYMHVDPAVEVLATTRFPVVNGYHRANGVVDMPVIWTKRWGLGRVYYNSLGHNEAIARMENFVEMMRRGFLWAAEGRDIAEKQGFDAGAFESSEKKF